MKKLGVGLLVLLVVLSFVSAQDEPVTGIDAAYACLNNIIDQKSESSISLEEAAFGVMALGFKNKLTSKIENSRNGACWPKPSCNLKDTAQVLLAYDRIQRDTDNIETWLVGNTGVSGDLNWFLQIDIPSHETSSCTINYRGGSHTINVLDDMRLDGNPGQCLSFSSSGFWMSISGNCLDETFQVSCDKDFVSNLLYQKQGLPTIYISPTTHSAASSGTTEERVSARCFSRGSSCDYEGSLWAAMALDKVGEDVSPFLPYLVANADDNQRLFPETFVYSISSGQDHFSSIVQSQRQGQFWQAPSTKYNKFYDTSLGMLALQSSGATEVGNAKSYLLSVQTPQGCWNNNNIRDTAFLLYSGWPISVSIGPEEPVPDPEPTTDGGPPPPPPVILPPPPIIIDPPINPPLVSCEPFYCLPGRFACENDAGGAVLGDRVCVGANLCCDSDLPPLPTCEGTICGFGEICDGGTVESREGTCCIGVCKQEETPLTNDCEDIVGGVCDFQCQGDETATSDSCPNLDHQCCVLTGGGGTGSTTVDPEPESRGRTTIVVILLILILLVILGILFRKRLQLLLFRKRGRKTGPGVRQTRTGDKPLLPPPRRPLRLKPRPNLAPRMPRPSVRAAPRSPPKPRPNTNVGTKAPKKQNKEDKEYEETLRRLKEMSE